jgi:hypothetical protein
LCPLVPLPHFHLFKDIVISYCDGTAWIFHNESLFCFCCRRPPCSAHACIASASHLLSSHCSNQLYMATTNFESMIMCSMMVTEIPILVYDVVCNRWCLGFCHSLLQY